MGRGVEMGEMDTGLAFMVGELNVLLMGVPYSSSVLPSSGKLLGGACPLWGTLKVTVAPESGLKFSYSLDIAG